MGYRVLERGIEWEVDGVTRRAEPGEILPDDFPQHAIADDLADGLIEETDAEPAAKPQPAARRKRGANANRRN